MLGAVWFVFCSSNNYSDFKKSESKFHGEGNLICYTEPRLFCRKSSCFGFCRMFQSRGKSCVCIYVCIAVSLMGSGCPRCLRLLQNSPQSGARKVAGRGLLSYRLSWHAVFRINGSVSPDQKNPFIFSCFLTSKSVELDLRELWI